MARRRARRVRLPDSERLRIIDKQSGYCAYCGSILHIKTCIIEEVRGKRSRSYSEPLEKDLKYWRNQKSKTEELPAFMIMHNSTLKSIVEARPYDKDSFLRIHNCGPVTWEKYGKEILAIVTKYNDIEEQKEDDDFEEISLQAICESCGSSKKQAIRIPQGQMDKIDDLEISVAEVVRLAVAQFLREQEPLPSGKVLPSGLEKHLVVRERDGVTVKIIYM